MTMQDKRAQNRQQLQSLLRELFQFDHADLDFGIYRIMREKHDDVERFIEHDLLDAVEEGLAHFQAAEREELETQLAEKRAMLGAAALDGAGAVRQEYRSLPIAQDYMRLHKQLRQLDLAEETEAQIFNDLWRFFSRYYDNGDFLTERRYSSREPKFCVPYNGEEVLLHWANRDQYYVKTGERFTDYRFTAGAPSTGSGQGYTVWFRLQSAEVPQDNVKAGTRYFVLRAEGPLAYDAESKALTIYFEYRPLTEEEEAHYLGVYNAQQSRSGRRKTLDRSALCVALEAGVLAGLDDADLKARLAAVPEGKTSSILGRHLNHYTARNTMDYFVHKDLGGFLRRELDFFLKNEVLRIDDVVRDESGEVMAHVLTRMRVVRQIADRIIAFLAQIEDFQKRLFEKKKFVVQTDYCVTLDRVPEELYPEILANEAQLDEWRRLYNVAAWENDLFWQGEFDEAFLHNHPYVMVDTAFFDGDFKARLLASFDDLDSATDGVLIHGENFQASNLMACKYEGQVQCVYIDPPYNTSEWSFVYKNSYKHSSWISMMADRVQLGRDFLTGDGVMAVAIDDTENHHLRMLLDSIFQPSNRLSTLAIEVNPAGQNIRPNVPALSHDYCHIYARDADETQLMLRELTPDEQKQYTEKDDKGYFLWDNLRRRGGNSRPSDRPGQWYPLYVDLSTRTVSVDPFEGAEEVWPIDPKGEERIWRNNPEGAQREIAAGEVSVIEKAGRVEVVKKTRMPKGKKPKTLWKSSAYSATTHGTKLLGHLVDITAFSYPKSLYLVQDCLRYWASKTALVLDYFAGSGTTGHAVIGLNREDDGDRKYILVEVGDYFDTVLKPRIQKVAFSANWKDGVPQDRDGQSHMFKYQRLESYEDALNNIRVRQPERAQRRLLYEGFGDYQLHYMLDFETRDSLTLLAQEAFENPFGYTLKIQRGHESPRDEKVDLVETFHYLIGMHVRRLERHEHQGRLYVVSRGEVRTERGVERTVVIWRDTPDLDLHQEADWANEALLAEPVDRVYVNGPSHIEGAQPLEIAFRQLMEPQN